jgi:hypothetical protein
MILSLLDKKSEEKATKTEKAGSVPVRRCRPATKREENDVSSPALRRVGGGDGGAHGDRIGSEA